MKSYSTSQAAKICGIHHVTLRRWISQRKIRVPKVQRVGGVKVRLWTEADLARVKEYKEKNFRRGRGRKPKAKA